MKNENLKKTTTYKQNKAERQEWTLQQPVESDQRSAVSHVLDVHGLLRPGVRVQSEGVVVGAVDV